MKNIWPKPINASTYEFVFLRDHPGRITSNSDEPPDSFHSKDLFTPHSSILGAWKYVGRLDDRVTLLNGEKVLPLPIEGRVREHAFVREAVVFGINRSVPGLLAFRAEAARNLSDEDFVNDIWPEIEAANQASEAFSYIGRDMVVPFSAQVEIPGTDKGSIIRAQVYVKFQKEIDNAYDRLEEREEGTLKLNLRALELYLTTLGQQIVGPQVSDIQTDFFVFGMNSLQAIQMRGSILRDLDLGGNGKKLGQNVVFDKGNIQNLAKHLYDLRLSHETLDKKPIESMRDMISKYSVFHQHIPNHETVPGAEVVVSSVIANRETIANNVIRFLLVQPELLERISLLNFLRDPVWRRYTALYEATIRFCDYRGRCKSGVLQSVTRQNCLF